MDIEEKWNIIKRAAYLINSLSKVKEDNKNIDSLNNVDGMSFESLKRNCHLLNREDFNEANHLLISFLKQRVRIKEINYQKELDSISVSK